MGRVVKNYKKYGYFDGIENNTPESAMRIFSQRRAKDVMKAFSDTLNFGDLLARIYYQGLMDGKDIYDKRDQD